MSSKEILDCALSLYGSNNKSFLDKLKNLRPKKIIGNLKKRIDEYNKKKELKNKYADEIVIMVKDRLRKAIEDDKKVESQPTSKENIEKEKTIKSNVKLVNNGIINANSKEVSHTLDDKSRIPIYDKELGSIIDTMKSGTFIYQDKDNFIVYRESDNKSKDLGITSQVEFPTLNQAIVYAIDDKLSITDVKDNFDKFKNDYGNLANYVKDKNWNGFKNGIMEKIDDVILSFSTLSEMNIEEIRNCFFEVGADNKDSIYYDKYCASKMKI